MIGPWRSSQAGIPITNRARNVALCSKANGFFTLYEAAPDTVHPAKTLVAEADGTGSLVHGKESRARRTRRVMAGIRDGFRCLLVWCTAGAGLA